MLLATPLRALRGCSDNGSSNGGEIGGSTSQQGARVLELALLSVRLAAAAAELATQCRGVAREEEAERRGGRAGRGGGGYIGAMRAVLQGKLARLEEAIRES